MIEVHEHNKYSYLLIYEKDIEVHKQLFLLKFNHL